MRTRSFAAAPLVLLVLGAIALSSSSTALAGKPTPCPIGSCINGPVTYPAGVVCPFPVRVEPVIDSTVVHALPNGDLFITGRLVQKATNLRTGLVDDVSPSGCSGSSSISDGTTTDISLGQLLWTFFSGDVGGPGLFLFKGRVVIQGDSSTASRRLSVACPTRQTSARC